MIYSNITNIPNANSIPKRMVEREYKEMTDNEHVSLFNYLVRDVEPVPVGGRLVNRSGAWSRAWSGARSRWRKRVDTIWPMIVTLIIEIFVFIYGLVWLYSGGIFGYHNNGHVGRYGAMCGLGFVCGGGIGFACGYAVRRMYLWVFSHELIDNVRTAFLLSDEDIRCVIKYVKNYNFVINPMMHGIVVGLAVGILGCFGGGGFLVGLIHCGCYAVFRYIRWKLFSVAHLILFGSCFAVLGCMIGSLIGPLIEMCFV